MGEIHRRLPSKNIIYSTAVLSTMVAGLACSQSADQPDINNTPTFGENRQTLILPTATSIVEVTSTPVPEKIDRPAKIGEKVADFAFPDIYGNIVRLSDFSGRPVVIYRCCYQPLNADKPYLELLKEYESRGLDSIIVVYPSVAEKILKVNTMDNIFKTLNFNHIISSEANGDLFSNYLSIESVPTLYAIDSQGILVDQRRSLGYFIRLDLLFDKLRNGMPVVEPQIPIDPALMGFATSLEAKRADRYFSYFFINNSQVTPDDQRFLNQNGQDINYLLEETNIENTIDLVIEKARERGKRLADIYCRRGSQPDTFREIVYNGTFTFNKFEMYKHVGLLVDFDWPAVAADLKPDCPIRDFPTQN